VNISTPLVRSVSGGCGQPPAARGDQHEDPNCGDRIHPGYQFGQGAPGAFPAYQLWAKNGWINNSDTHYDYAFTITQNNAAGQRVVERVGGNGLTVNPGRPFVTFIG
jgi:hypothetical protein